MNPTTQTLLRSVIKIGAGYLASKGVADQSSSEIFVSVLIALIGILWGILHRTGNTERLRVGELRVESATAGPGYTPAPPSPVSASPRLPLPLIILSASLLLTGCVSYTSRITMPDGTTLALPKDAAGDSLVLEREFTDAIGRTNRLRLSLTNFVFRMNPAVIDAKTKHDIAVFNAGADAAGKIISANPK